MRYLLNSAVLTSFGTWKYEPVSADDARRWYEAGGCMSTVGYEETAAVLTELLGHEIVVNKRSIEMRAGDEALVFRLVFAVGTQRLNPQDKGAVGRAALLGNYELGLLRRIE